MGLLDEAIKEHLELKRRRGADPEDVAREEREALGPAVREVRESMTGDQGPAAAEAVAAADAAEAGDVAVEGASETTSGAEAPDHPESAPGTDPSPPPPAEPAVDQATQ